MNMIKAVHCIFVVWLASCLADLDEQVEAGTVTPSPSPMPDHASDLDAQSTVTGGRRRHPPPPPPPPRPTLPPPSPHPPGAAPCELSWRCIQGLKQNRGCLNIARNGGHDCYKGMYVHHADLVKYGCPNFYDKSKAIYQAQAFCWCGLDEFASVPTPTLNHSIRLPQLPDVEYREEANEENSLILKEDTTTAADGNKTDSVELRSLLNKRAAKDSVSSQSAAPRRLDKACHNKKDGKTLKKKGKSATEDVLRACAKSCTGVEGCTAAAGKACFEAYISVGSGCASCFGAFIQCSDDNCIEECACGSSQVCNSCNDAHCKAAFDGCSGLKGHDARSSFMSFLPPSTNEGEDSLVV